MCFHSQGSTYDLFAPRHPSQASGRITSAAATASLAGTTTSSDSTWERMRKSTDPVERAVDTAGGTGGGHLVEADYPHVVIGAVGLLEPAVPVT